MSEQTMSEQTQMRGRVKGEILDVYTAGHDREIADIDGHTRRIVELVRADERQRIVAALMSDEAIQAANDAWFNWMDDPDVPGDSTCMGWSITAALAAIGISTEEEATDE